MINDWIRCSPESRERIRLQLYQLVREQHLEMDEVNISEFYLKIFSTIKLVEVYFKNLKIRINVKSLKLSLDTPQKISVRNPCFDWFGSIFFLFF